MSNNNQTVFAVLLFGLMLTFFILKQFWIPLNLINSVLCLSNDTAKNYTAEKVLILAYPRTGSSFLGDILSSSEYSFYLFEPLRKVTNVGHRLQGLDEWSPTLQANISDFLQDAFSCQNKAIDLMKSKNKEKLHKNLDSCQNSTFRVIKTIRLHSLNILPWINQTKIKVVHLVRDPRAILNSMMKNPKTWREYIDNFPAWCSQMSQDSKLRLILPQQRYFLVQYEELVEQPISVLTHLFNQFNLVFDTVAADAFFAHARLPEKSLKRARYFSTYRSDTDAFKWKDELPLSQIRKVERQCSQFMSQFGYTTFEEE